MYHRITNPSDSPVYMQPGMYVEPSTFDMHLAYLKRNFSVVPLRSIMENLNNESKPTCVLTFDDGWLDFYKYAYPILKKHALPATVFLPTGFIGTKSWFWADRFIFFMDNYLNTLERNNNHSQKNVSNDKAHESYDKIEVMIQRMKGIPKEIIDEFLDSLAELSAQPFSIPGRAFLNWDEVKTMLKSSLITFGSHSVNHPILTSLSEHQVMEELSHSRQKLIDEGVIDKSFCAFCYPNGSFNRHIARLVEHTGYHVAVTTDFGWNQRKANKYTLCRIGIHQDISSSIPLFAIRTANLF